MPERWVFPGSTLDRVKDGDTFIADLIRTVDFGFHLKTTLNSRQTFRLNRCAAAPLSTPSGSLAMIQTQRLLAASPFTLTSVGPYKYGDEWMAEVELADGRNLTDYLIEQQYAAAWNGRGTQPLPPWPRTIA